ncbi:branched-chain amino acid ABC transporter permease [Dysosmobacter sp. NSJ-60]|uniref:Branched-chain amino acid ABC transporter permease n=1 Tax=Pusillibacter faecalis TaxID=2714358 RepID=A0A810Q5G3_9FIRM|nr:branched-chain amino acid ABC transporter permease [Pusillibacter faecalis]MBC5746688.1 branched-chain amino acid ABC transporter permease [Dysosmobacter hominis]MBS5657933.1 branched-chain amino acid ABC transporter permease [Oscillibacter sp.]MCQ5025283.1 branched-chain amino acid ABC transporter permease [Oscillibacter valericigenes]BCK83549.1 branched-chain amino acid ABC transporter permease [Pusillibacter faecalis]
MKKLRIQKHTRTDFLTYLGVIAAFAVLSTLNASGGLSRSLSGQLVPICCYMSMAVSLNLTVGILGELSLGHAGFMSVGAFSGIIAAMSLQSAIPSEPIRLAIAMVVGALVAALAGVIVGTPVLRLRGDYLAIVTLAFGEIIKELVNCLLVGHDSRGLHIALNITGSKSIADLHLEEDGLAIIKGAQGAAGTNTIATFTAGFLLVMVTLAVVLNLKHSRAGRAVMALRDNSIAAESIGLNITKYKMMAFVTSAALAGAAGALYGLNFSSLQATKFNFNTSILILVFVVLGGLGNIWGSLIAAAALTVLPEMLRAFSDYRMLVYAIVLILVMLATNNPTFKVFFSRFRRGGSRKSTGKEAM